MTIYTDQKLSRNSRKTHKWLRSSEPKSVYFCVRNIIFFLYRPENQKLMKKLYWLRASRFWGVKSDQKSETSEKNPEMIASEPKCSYFRVGFFFFYHRPENQKIKKKLLRASRNFWYFWVWNTILLNILLINHMVCRYNKLCPCARKS